MTVPQAVLSEHLQERLRGRRLVSAALLTFTFDPGFFEQEVLPVILDLPASHAVPVRLAQLEDALSKLPGQVAVYYDADGLRSEVGRARLDVLRVPVRKAGGFFFHPKNLLLLVEDPAEEGPRARSLLVVALSANLTRGGWWENVEACHVVEVEAGAPTALRDDLLDLLRRVRALAPDGLDHRALDDVGAFLRGTTPRVQRSVDGALHPHVYVGRGGQSVPDFLEEVAGRSLQGLNLEVLSPFLDDADTSAPLEELVRRFSPREVRVLLPRTRAAAAACRPAFHAAVEALPRVRWGRLPAKLLQLTTKDGAAERFVHAKVYRFFSARPRREVVFLGSPNLTVRAHAGGKNLETGLLVEVEGTGRPDFWLEPETGRPAAFQPQDEGEGSSDRASTDLVLRYRWDTRAAEACWVGARPSARLRLFGDGSLLGECGPLARNDGWISLAEATATALRRALDRTPLVEVHQVDAPDRPAALVLVLEEGMSHKQSILLTLSAADILRYWSLLTPAQRAAFIEARGAWLPRDGEPDLSLPVILPPERQDTIFDRVAGFFHAFGCLERSVRQALEEQREREAIYRLFGTKYDSLGTLLDRVREEERTDLDQVDRYLLLLCAKQLVQGLTREFPDFFQGHRADVGALEQRLEDLDGLRRDLAAGDPAEIPRFLEWFERQFLRRARREEGP